MSYHLQDEIGGPESIIDKPTAGSDIAEVSFLQKDIDGSLVSAFVLNSDNHTWAPICESTNTWQRITVVEKSPQCCVIQLDDSIVLVDIYDDFEWVKVREDFYEAYDPRSSKRVGLYFPNKLSADKFSQIIIQNTIRLILKSCRSLPPPSELRLPTRIFFDENTSRYCNLPASWACINKQIGVNVEVLQKCRDGIFRGVPILLIMLEKVFRISGGYVTEGIFRVPADNELCNDLKNKINTGAFNGCSNAHVLASLIKSFFRELSLKIFTDPIARHTEDVDIIISTVAPIYKPIVQWLVQFLGEIAANEVSNRMSIKNLAVVFVPNLFLLPYDETVILETKKAIDSFAILIENYAK